MIVDTFYFIYCTYYVQTVMDRLINPIPTFPSLIVFKYHVKWAYISLSKCNSQEEGVSNHIYTSNDNVGLQRTSILLDILEYF
jgi:hypothetical protein